MQLRRDPSTSICVYVLRQLHVSPFRNKSGSRPSTMIVPRLSSYCLARNVCASRVGSRYLFGLTPGGDKTSRRKKYSEKRVLGWVASKFSINLVVNCVVCSYYRWSREQLFEIVSNVDEYHLFLPACTKSFVTHRRGNLIKADLEIGIPPILLEKYTSEVTLEPPHLVRAQCYKGKLFEHLMTEWKFSEGVKGNDKVSELQLNAIRDWIDSLRRLAHWTSVSTLSSDHSCMLNCHAACSTKWCDNVWTRFCGELVKSTAGRS